MNEIWRAVPDYEGVYEVSDLGRVRRISAASGTQPGRVLKPTSSESAANPYGGYHEVRLSSGSVRRRRVHDLVAQVFLGPKPSPAHQVNHRDGVKTNNAAGNLEWATAGENLAHAYATGLRRRVGPPRNRWGPVRYGVEAAP